MIIEIYFCFLNYKNYNRRKIATNVLTISKLVGTAFISNKLLVVFAFLIAKILNIEVITSLKIYIPY